MIMAENEHFDTFMSATGTLKCRRYDLLLRQCKPLNLQMLCCTAHTQLLLSIKDLQSHISLDQGAESLRVKDRSKS